MISKSFYRSNRNSSSFRKEKVLNNLVKIGNHELAVKEFRGQRVVTLNDIDLVHERPGGTSRRNFNENKERFIEGEDFIVRNSYEAKTEFDIVAPNGLTLITEQGYLMLVKSFTDNLAWKVQRDLVNTYFKARNIYDELSPELQAIIMQDKKLQAVVEHINKTDTRVDKLENNMTIDYGQQLVLREKVNSAVISWLCGKDSNAYREMSKKVFSECNRDLQNYFSVNSRNNIPKLKYDDAVYYIGHWEPCMNTKLEIMNCNAQMNL